MARDSEYYRSAMNMFFSRGVIFLEGEDSDDPKQLLRNARERLLKNWDKFEIEPEDAKPYIWEAPYNPYKAYEQRHLGRPDDTIAGYARSGQDMEVVHGSDKAAILAELERSFCVADRSKQSVNECAVRTANRFELVNRLKALEKDTRIPYQDKKRQIRELNKLIRGVK